MTWQEWQGVEWLVARLIGLGSHIWDDPHPLHHPLLKLFSAKSLLTYIRGFPDQRNNGYLNQGPSITEPKEQQSTRSKHDRNQPPKCCHCRTLSFFPPETWTSQKQTIALNSTKCRTLGFLSMRYWTFEEHNALNKCLFLESYTCILQMQGQCHHNFAGLWCNM